MHKRCINKWDCDFQDGKMKSPNLRERNSKKSSTRKECVGVLEKEKNKNILHLKSTYEKILSNNTTPEYGAIVNKTNTKNILKKTLQILNY